MSANFIEALVAEVAALEAELQRTPTYRRLRRARELLAEYESSKSELLPSLNETVADRAAQTVSRGAHPQPVGRQRKEETQTILDAVVEILRDRDEPVRTANILTMLRERGLVIPGERALNNLSAMISYSKMFKAHGKAGWTMLDPGQDEQNQEASDDPNYPGRTSEASFEHRPTSGGTTSMPVEPRQGGVHDNIVERLRAATGDGRLLRC